MKTKTKLSSSLASLYTVILIQYEGVKNYILQHLYGMSPRYIKKHGHKIYPNGRALNQDVRHFNNPQSVEVTAPPVVDVIDDTPKIIVTQGNPDEDLIIENHTPQDIPSIKEKVIREALDLPMEELMKYAALSPSTKPTIKDFKKRMTAEKTKLKK